MTLEEFEDVFDGHANELEKHLSNLKERHRELAQEEGDALEKVELLRNEFHRIESLENSLRSEGMRSQEERFKLAKQYDFFMALLQVVTEEVEDIDQKIKQEESEFSTIEDIYSSLLDKQENLQTAYRDSNLDVSPADKDWDKDSFVSRMENMSADEIRNLIS